MGLFEHFPSFMVTSSVKEKRKKQTQLVCQKNLLNNKNIRSQALILFAKYLLSYVKMSAIQYDC